MSELMPDLPGHGLSERPDASYALRWYARVVARWVASLELRRRAHELALPPIAVFWGDRDRIIPIQHGRELAESIEGVVFVPFAGCGHYLHRTRPLSRPSRAGTRARSLHRRS